MAPPSSSSSSKKAVGAAASPCRLECDPNKATPAMRQSLESLRSSLLCPLCNRALSEPATLGACAHSFCKSCIENSNADSWTCPVVGCDIPVMTTGRGSTVSVNPQLNGVVTALTAVVDAINSAPDGWWRRSWNGGGVEEEGATAPLPLSSSSIGPRRAVEGPDGVDDRRIASVSFATEDDEGGEEDDDEEMIDLQREREARTSGSDEEDDDDSSTSSMLSALEENAGSPSDAKCGRRSSTPMRSTSNEGGIGGEADSDSVASTRPKGGEMEVSTPKALEEETKSSKVAGSNEIGSNEMVVAADSEVYEKAPHAEEAGADRIDGGTRKENDGDDTSMTQEYNVTDSLVSTEGYGNELSTVAEDAAEESDDEDDATEEEETTEGGACQSPTHLRFQTPSPPSLEERSRLNQSCAIPSCSPSCSPIDKSLSQAEAVVGFDTDDKAMQDAGSDGAPAVIDSTRDGDGAQSFGKDRKDTSASPSADDGQASSASRPKRHRESSARKSRRSVTRQPKVFFLSPPSTLSSSDVRSVRKCIKNGRFGILRNDLVEGYGDDRHENSNDSDLDWNFDFDTDEGRASFLSSLSSEDEAAASSPPVYAISASAEFQQCDGYVVARSFRYLLAVACGFPIVDVSYIREAASTSTFAVGAAGPQRYLNPPPLFQKGGKGKGDEAKVYAVSGDVESSDWNAALRAREAAQSYVSTLDDASQNLNVGLGTGLLEGHVLLLHGEFDHIASRRRLMAGSIGGRKRSRAMKRDDESDRDESKLYSKGQIVMLLRLCGAQVADLTAVADAMARRCMKGSSTSEVKSGFASDLVAFTANDVDDIAATLSQDGCNKRVENLAVLVRNNPCARDYRLAEKYLASRNIFTRENSQANGKSLPPVIGANWLLDSISNFTAKNFDDYLGGGGKARRRDGQR